MNQQSDIRHAIVRHYAPQLWPVTGAYLASVARSVLRDAEQGDRVARQIITRCEHLHATTLLRGLYREAMQP